MKVALAQINYTIGDFDTNVEKAIKAINKSKEAGADIVVFAELSLTGYPPRDFLDFDEFIQLCWDGIDKIKAKTENIAVVIGAPTRNKNKKGKPLRNSAIFIHNKEVISIHNKALLPTYDIFDEYRYFQPETEFSTIEFKGKKIAITVCEDIWNTDDYPIYEDCPMDHLINDRPELMINLTASPFDINHHEDRLKTLIENTSKYKIPIVYVNHVGAQTELIFDGGSMVMNKDGLIEKQLKFFEEDLQIWDSEASNNPITDNAPKRIDRIKEAIVLGIKDYFRKLGFKKAVIGLSGGIDSALTAALAVEALGQKNVLGVLMPSEFSSDHSIEDAEALASNLGIETHSISIKDTFNSFQVDLKPIFKDLPFGIAEENIQARIRGSLLMAISNKFGSILLNTSNKSEAAVGYGTLYGDMNGGLSVIGDLYKTEVFELSRHFNKDVELIPWNTIKKEPSAELRPDQKDSDSLPDYETLDKILELYINQKQGREDIIAMGFDKDLVGRILKLVNTNEYKRYQTSPVLRVSSKAFGMGRRMPIVAKYLI